MDSTDEQAVDELRDLVHDLRTHLARRAALGGWALPGGASPRLARGSLDGAIDAAVDAATPAMSGGGDSVGRGEAIDAVGYDDDAAAQPAAPPPPDIAGAAVYDAPIPLPIYDAPDADAPSRAPVRRSLAQIAAEVGPACPRCKLSQRRSKVVFGVGDPRAPLVFIGEAPGAQEDRRGEPFVGPSGELLDKMIEAMGWTRQSVYITNVVMCRPPDNRNPEPDELAACMPFLHAKLEAIGPRIVVALGRPAANNVLGTDASIHVLRGKFHDRRGYRVMPTYHPAYLLRDADKKRETWNDLKLVIAELERLGINAPNPARA